MPPADIIPGDLGARECYGSASESYPWSEWLDGQQRRLHQGQDFACGPATLRQMAYKRANARGLKVRTKIDKAGASIRLQAYRL